MGRDIRKYALTKNDIEEGEGFQYSVLSMVGFGVDYICQRWSGQTRDKNNPVTHIQACQWVLKHRTQRSIPHLPHLLQKMQGTPRVLIESTSLTPDDGEIFALDSPSHSTPASPRQPSSILVEMGLRSRQKPKPSLDS